MYNVFNNGTGDDMVNERNTGALINQIRDVTRDHIDWIKEQLLKKDSFMTAKGREVWIDVPNSKLKNIVTIPNKEEASYREAWAKVYNLAVDYLEGCLSFACIKGDLDYKSVKWPEFNPENANYARELEKTWNEYKLKLINKLKEQERASSVMVSKSSVMLEPQKNNTDIYQNDLPKETTPRHAASAPHQTKKDSSPKPQADIPAKPSEIQTSQPLEFRPIDLETANITTERKDNIPVIELSVRKLLDGDKLSKKDVSKLKDEGADVVVIPCQNMDNTKEEKRFFDNMRVCSDDNLKTGVMIYGKATDEKEAAYELKKIFKLLDQCDSNFIRWVIYEVNDDFVKKNETSEMTSLSFINGYTMIADGLAQSGFWPTLSMNVTSRRILEDIYKRYNLKDKCEVVYMALVRELDELSKEDSIILMDPQYDYDMITFRNPNYNSAEVIKEVLQNESPQNTTLAKVA